MMSPFVFTLVWFQFTLPRGERHDTERHFYQFMMFQFTLPRGERRMGAGYGANQRDRFNSRSREGSDIIPPKVMLEGRFSFNSRSREGSDSVGKSITN